MLSLSDSQRISGARRWAGPAALALASVALPRPARADQVVVIDETYTATAQNTSDSHYRIAPRAGTPTNWRSPVDYASGRAHARLEVITKPSTRKTLYNICYEATPSYACMGYSPAYTTPGVYDFEFPFSTFYQYNMVDWSKGVRQIALILKDENEAKKQGDPAFYPTKIHITLTIVAPGSTYVPPMAMTDAGVETDAAMPSDGGAVVDAGVADAAMAGRGAAGTGTGTGMGMGGASGTTAGSGGRISVGAGAGGAASAGGEGARAASGTGGVGVTPGASPPAAPPSTSNEEGTGCAVARGRSMQALVWLWLGTGLFLFRRVAARRRPRTQGDIYG